MLQDHLQKATVTTSVLIGPGNFSIRNDAYMNDNEFFFYVIYPSSSCNMAGI